MPYTPHSVVMLSRYTAMPCSEQKKTKIFKYINLKIINILHDFINDEAP